MEFKYKLGDRVRVVDKFIEGKEYRMLSGTDAGCITRVLWSYDERAALAGSVVTITGYFINRYRINGRTGMEWTDEMFTGLADDNECYCDSLL